jgi:hypothetical protein
METQEESLKKINALDKKMEPLTNKLHNIMRKDEDDIEKKIKLCHALKYKFDPKELRYASINRCICGAGLAYPLKIGMHGCWHCSAILTGIADVNVQHDEGFPFAFYEIRSEDQSDNEQTTRPKT